MKFGPFLFNVAERTLHNGGESVSLKPKEFDLLQVLVAKPGRLISKDEILSEVWPETKVEESNLSVHISSLRRALGDSASDPLYIETIPRSGYRFKAPVIELIPGEGEVDVAPPAMSRSLGRLLRWAVLIVASTGAAVWWARRSYPPWNAVPLTSSPGLEIGPALSPDGSLVIYSVRARTANGRLDPSTNGLWLKNIATGATERVTDQFDYSPTWSPDGREIAFVRYINNQNDQDVATLVVRSAFGGQDRIVRPLDYVGALPGPSLHYSSNGKWILTSLGTGMIAGTPPARLVAISLATGELQPLLSPVPGSAGDFNPVISPKGDRLAFCRCATSTACDLFTVPVADLKPMGPPQRISQIPSSDFQPLFLPDGSILYSLGPNNTRNLWRTHFDWFGSFRSEQISPSSEDVLQPSVVKMADGRWRLVYVRDMVDINIWRLQFDGPDGKPIGSEPIANSTRIEETPAYSRDGKRIAFASNRTGQWEIWGCDVTGRNCAEITHLRAYSRSPAWSPDGRWLAFDSRPTGSPQVFVMPLDPSGPAVAVTPVSSSSSMEPAWSADGRWLYFSSNRTGRYEIYRTPSPVAGLNPGKTEAVTADGGIQPRMSVDGTSLFYRIPDRSFLQLNLRDGTKKPLPSGMPIAIAPIPGSSTVGYFYRAENRQGYAARFNLTTGTVENLIALPNLSRAGNMARSPDGRQLLYVQTDRHEADLMMIDNLHP